MKFLKIFASKSAAVGKKIPSPCAVKYTQENAVDYFMPAGNRVVETESYTIKTANGKNYAE
jgi:hypothetical protein